MTFETLNQWLQPTAPAALTPGPITVLHQSFSSPCVFTHASLPLKLPVSNPASQNPLHSSGPKENAICMIHLEMLLLLL